MVLGLESWILPDSAYIASTTFSSALIEDNREFHLIPSLELQAILHFFYMKEQLLAITHFIGDETKLEATKKRKKTDLQNSNSYSPSLHH